MCASENMKHETGDSERRAIGALLVGDELLTGKRVDKHLPKLIELLAARGLELSWAQYVGDDAARLRAVLARTLADDDIVFSFGGIGATPDDRTRQCAAAAAGLELAIHPEGRAVLEERFGDRLYPHRIRMVEWPVGAEPIPNPVNGVPGFSLRHHHFVPGFPSMAWPMVEWVLDRRYAEMHNPDPPVEYLIEVRDTPESELIDLMEAIMAAHPSVRLACLPNASGRRVIELGLRGPRAAAVAAYDALVGALTDQVLPMTPLRAPEDESAA
ncbi:molybdopterin binding domain-containing protein [Salinisphaera sp. PC39]